MPFSLLAQKLWFMHSCLLSDSRFRELALETEKQCGKLEFGKVRGGGGYIPMVVDTGAMADVQQSPPHGLRDNSIRGESDDNGKMDNKLILGSSRAPVLLIR